MLAIPLGVFALLSLGSAQALATAPTVTSLSPNNGLAAGGTSVTIAGTGFVSPATVKFGETSATGVTVNSSTSITAKSPVGSGTVNVTVTDTNGTSAAVSHDWFAYELSGPWLGLNGNSVSNKGSEEWLGPVNEFSQHSVVYDRSFELTAGQVPSEVEVKSGGESYFEERLKYDHEYDMRPVSVIEYKGYDREGYRFKSDPEFPQTRTKKEEEEGKNTINGYVEKFVASASAILKAVSEKYPSMSVLFEPMNEPWGYTTPQYSGAEYAAVIAKLLPAAKEAGIPLTDIYVAAIGKNCTKTSECTANGWVSAMYSAQASLKTEVQGWYFHPYGPPTGHSPEDDSEGIQGVPLVREKMTSGQNNIIVSEVGYCDHEINEALESPVCGGEGETGTKAASNLATMLESALPYREARWLKALIVYSRDAGGWAMQEYPSKVLSKGGESLRAFADSYGLGWWSIQSTPNPGSGGQSSLHAVSCLSSSACTAVGSANIGYYEEPDTVPIVEVWNGTTWSTQTVPHPESGLSEPEASLSGVSCISSTSCAAVGAYEISSFQLVTLAEQWNGTAWSVKSTPNPTGAQSTVLGGVSCTSSTTCTAVGAYENSSSKWLPFAEVWNGTEWTIQTMSGPVGVETSILESVSCTSSSACTAVGNYYYYSGKYIRATLVERWNGTGWSIQSSPNPGTTYSRLSGVSCSSSIECIATGSYVTGSETEATLAERWDGTEWSTQSTPNPTGLTGSWLQAVSCVAPMACTATGTYSHKYSGSLFIRGTLVERWNGTSWVIQPSPNRTGEISSDLAGVACASSVVCEAVGTEDGGGSELTLAERYTE